LSDKRYSLVGERQFPAILLAVAITASLASMWILPCRMIFGEYGTAYTFARLYDEVTYANEIQPLNPGTTATNPLNRFGDEQLISQHFMEDIIRQCLTVMGGNAIDFFWFWRFMFPLFLLLACAFLAYEALGLEKRAWRGLIVLSAGVFGAAMMACEPLLFWHAFPPEGWIERTPTNIEFLIAILFAALYLRALRAPTTWNWIRVACLLSLLVYVRLFCAFPWGVAAGCGALLLLIRRQMTVSTAMVTVAALGLCLTPWLVVHWQNSHLNVQAQLVRRVFQNTSFAVHYRWWLLWLFAALCGVGAWITTSRDRLFAGTTGLTLLVLPFTSIVVPFGIQLQCLDRFSTFYWPLTVTIALLLSAQWVRHWKGWRGWHSRRRCMTCCSAAAIVLSAVMAIRATTYDLLTTPWPVYRQLVKEGACLSTYNWIANNTSPKALFLVDDGQYWSEEKVDLRPNPLIDWAIGEHDLFSLIAHRQRVFNTRLLIYRITDEEFMSLGYLHCGTFGLPLMDNAYSTLLKRYRPDYVFWHKNNPIFRKPSPILLAMSEIVHSDENCEVWKLKWN
jgi:hypothetical protein